MKNNKNNFKMFSLVSNNAIKTLPPVVLKHLILLENKISKYFSEVKIVNYDWTGNLFLSLCTSGFNLTLQEDKKPSSITADHNLKIN